jgi:ankyrin repeat protein
MQGLTQTQLMTMTLLMEATMRNRLHMVDVLMSRRANVNQKDRYGCTDLHVVFRRYIS